jgi:hypothetical protein
VNAGQKIAVTAVGAFDANGDGFTQPVNVGIFNVTTTALVPGTTVTLTGTNALASGDRLITLPAPVVLGPLPTPER